MTTRVKIWILALVCISLCFVHAEQQEVEDEYPVDPRFDPGSAGIARSMQNMLANSLPHTHIPISNDRNSSIPIETSQLKPWAYDLAKTTGAGFAIAILSFVIGVGWLMFRLFKLCCSACCECCKSKKGNYTSSQKIIPSGFYFFFWIWVLIAMIFGFLNNPRFTEGTTELTGHIGGLADNTDHLFVSIISGVQDIANGIGPLFDKLGEYISGLPDLALDVQKLGQNVEGTVGNVYDIQRQLHNITGSANIPPLAAALADIDAITNNSVRVLESTANLTNEIGTQLLDVFNRTITVYTNFSHEMNKTVADLSQQAETFIDGLRTSIAPIKSGLVTVNSYDHKRQQGLTAIFVICLISMSILYIGFFVPSTLFFHISTGFGFIFLVLFWLSGSVHLLVGLALSDACPVINTTLTGLIISQGDQVASVFTGCLNDESIFDAVGIPRPNISNYYDYRGQFDKFTEFVDKFNFSTIDDYFNQIQSIKKYNLSKDADNLTVETFGWSPNNVTIALNGLNDATSPRYFSIQNWTSCVPATFSNRDEVQARKDTLNATIIFNQTITDQVADTKKKMNDAQKSINNMTTNIDQFKVEYDIIEDNITTMSTTNVSNAIGVIDGLSDQINEFYDNSRCGFVGDDYYGSLNATCSVMQPATDVLMATQLLAGLVLIPMVILAQVLSCRIPRKNMGGITGAFKPDDDADSSDDEDDGKYKKRTISPAPSYNTSTNNGPKSFSAGEQPAQSDFLIMNQGDKSPDSPSPFSTAYYAPEDQNSHAISRSGSEPVVQSNNPLYDESAPPQYSVRDNDSSSDDDDRRPSAPPQPLSPASNHDDDDDAGKYAYDYDNNAYGDRQSVALRPL